jgi:hypothetical protein
MFCNVIIYLGASNWSITYIRIYTERSECHVIAGPLKMQRGVQNLYKIYGEKFPIPNLSLM